MSDPRDLEARAEAFARPLADAHDEALAAGYVERGAVASRPHRQRDDEAKVPRLRFVPASEFLKPPTPPNWMIDGIAETDSFCVLFGDPESGKSFMAMDWACCVATKTEWKGKRVKHGPVLYINGEGHNGVNRRLTAWSIANGVNLREHPLYLSSTTTALTDEVSRAEFEAVVADFVHQHGKPAMIVIDTLARNFGPGDENSSQDMQRAVETVDAIRTLTGAWIVVIHHSGHGDKSRARGSIVLKAAADTEYRMGRLNSGGDTLLESTKMKDGNKPAPMTFRFADVELGVQDEHGHEVTSAVLIQTHYDPSEVVPTPPSAQGRGKNQSKALALLEDMLDARRRRFEDSGRDPDLARVTMLDWCAALREAGVGRNRVGEVTRALTDAGRVIRDGDFVRPAEVESCCSTASASRAHTTRRRPKWASEIASETRPKWLRPNCVRNAP